MNNSSRSAHELLAILASKGTAVTRKSISATANASTLQFNESLLQKINKEISPSPINGFASLVNFSPTSDQAIHRWFRYREGYSTALVKDLIKNLPKGSVVLDPFCGAGTSLLAAREVGLPSIGLDVNPISILVSRVKTTNFSPSLKLKLIKHIELLQEVDENHEADTKPLFKIIDKVYAKDILTSLLIFRRAIKNISDVKIREFIFVAWLSILESVSNVYKEGNGLKYKNRKRTEDGYIHIKLEEWQSIVFPKDQFSFVKNRLIEQLNSMVHDLQFMPTKEGDVIIFEDAAENLDKHILPNSIDISVFSPPYCNCFNYFKMYKVELWMGEFVKSYEDMQRLNRRGLRSHVETVLKRKDDKEEPISEEFASLLDGLALWDRRIPKAVRGYFIDMKQVLENLHKVLKPGGKTVIVVGNSAYGGVVIPTDAILAKIAVELGFKFEKLAVARHLTTSSQQKSSLSDRKDYLRESILVLTKEDPRHKDHELISVDEIPTRREFLDNNVFAIKNSGLTAFTHKFHRYPGKFIPHIPRWALNSYLNDSLNAVVLDPFCGSGTTLVESMLHGHKSYGIDIDPIARLVSKVKTTKIDIVRLQHVVEDISKKIARRTKSKFKPTIPTLSHWFSDNAVQDLGVIRDTIEEYKDDTDIYDFLIICFASIIRRVSNADNQTQKTYVSHTKIKKLEDAKPLFLSVLIDYSKRMCDISTIKNTGKSSVLKINDARNFSEYWKRTKLPNVDLIVTSPPYLNSVDYIYNQMAEYFWIGDLFTMETQNLQNIHKRKYIGSDNVSSQSYQSISSTGIPEIDEIVKRLFTKNKKNAYVVSQYFLDMKLHFENAIKVLKPGGNYVCVIGDSLVSGESIPVHELLVKCAEIAGFKFNYQFGYEIRNRHMRFPRMGRGGIVRYDWILNLTKS